jgi:hypothetical protein
MVTHGLAFQWCVKFTQEDDFPAFPLKYLLAAKVG